MEPNETPQFAEDYFRMLGRDWKHEKLLVRLKNLLTNHALRYLLTYRKLQQKKDPLMIFRCIRRIIRQHYGLELDSPAIGAILSNSMKYLATGAWWLAFFPGLMMVAIVLLTFALGDDIKQLTDPHTVQE